MLNLKRKAFLFIALSTGICLLTGCGSANEKSDSSENSESMSAIAESEELTGDYYVTLIDGDDYTEYPVNAYGEEFELPDYDATKEGDFYGWLGHYGLYQPGEMAVAEEFMGFTALRSTSDAGTLALLNTVNGGSSVLTTEEPSIDLYSMEAEFIADNSDEYFDYWTDDAGNKYESKDSVKVEKGKVVILTAVYSSDFSNAYKVTYYNNNELDEEEHCRYVKKGNTLPIVVFFEPAGYVFDGWYDDPEAGNYITGDGEMFTPDSDITLYAHWIEDYPQIVNIDQVLYYRSAEKCMMVPRKAPDGVIETFYPVEIMPDMPDSANFGEEYEKLEYMFLEDESLIVHVGEQWIYFEKE